MIGQGKNGLEAVNLIKELLPELVFLDVQMPWTASAAWAESVRAVPGVPGMSLALGRSPLWIVGPYEEGTWSCADGGPSHSATGRC